MLASCSGVEVIFSLFVISLHLRPMTIFIFNRLSALNSSILLSILTTGSFALITLNYHVLFRQGLSDDINIAILINSDKIGCQSVIKLRNRYRKRV